jgi:hypothetical protein
MSRGLIVVETDLYSSKPWAYSPLLATMNTVHITHDIKPSKLTPSKIPRLSESTFLSPLDGSKTPPKGPITHAADRRKWLSSHSVRTGTAFPSTYVAGDFSNEFIDFNTFSVHLPYVGLKVDVLKYWTKGNTRQPLRYVCRTRPGHEEETVFFVVLFELVGDDVIHDDSEDEKVDREKLGMRKADIKESEKTEAEDGLGVD